MTIKAQKWGNKDRESGTFDTGRRGEPRPGCDCVRCFGYCLVDRDEQARAVLIALEEARKAKREKREWWLA